MAWSTPRDWSVGDLVTAAMLNTNVRDNLKYLHGDAGAVSLSDTLKLPTTASGNGKGLRITDGTTDFANFQGLDLSGTSYIFFSTNRQFDGSAWQQLNTRVGGNLQISGDELVYINFPVSSSTSTERFRIKSDGKVGIGTASPQSRLHVTGAASGGFMHADNSGIVGSVVSILPASTVTRFMYVLGVAESSAGVATVGGTIGLSGNYDVVIGGVDTFRTSVNANGSVDFKRQAGSNAIHASVILVWV